ncbi:MAG TPA: endonuclease III [Chloroflexota bacterium]|nr:endonuclease III [Chloroflexota bacterium]
MLTRIRKSVAQYPKAALFELRDLGYGSVFQQLVACIVSIRTRDEQTLPLAQRLFERASTPQAIASLAVDDIAALIHECAFHDAKARQIKAIAERTASEYGGDLPCDFEVLTSFGGVGPKCANLALGIACGSGGIGVDVHVHRVTNRWGYVAAPTAEKTMAALEEQLPKRYWVTINELLVPFGKHICTGTLPKCSTCPVLEFCQQVGVTRHR